MKAPCETIIWKLLPTLRKELAKSLVQDFGLSQSMTAKKLGLTDAAVSQYLSAKRAKVTIEDEDVKAQIKESAKRISKGDVNVTKEELCRLCYFVRDIEGLSELCGETSDTCDVCDD